MEEKRYDLENRCFLFAKRIRAFLKNVPFSLSNREDSIQLIRSSGSVGANYLESNEGVSRKDFLYRVKVCRKEAKESTYWLNLIDIEGKIELEPEQKSLFHASIELQKIFLSIIKKFE